MPTLFPSPYLPDYFVEFDFGPENRTSGRLDGEVWMVDSRRISHQIFYGRRALSVDYIATPQSMSDPRKHYLAPVERYRRDRGLAFTPKPI